MEILIDIAHKIFLFLKRAFFPFGNQIHAVPAFNHYCFYNFYFKFSSIYKIVKCVLLDKKYCFLFLTFYPNKIRIILCFTHNKCINKLYRKIISGDCNKVRKSFFFLRIYVLEMYGFLYIRCN